MKRSDIRVSVRYTDGGKSLRELAEESFRIYLDRQLRQGSAAEEDGEGSGDARRSAS